MKRLMRAAPLLLLLCLAASARGQKAAGQQVLVSPNGRVEVVFALNEFGAPSYRVRYDGRAVVNPSALGLVLKDGGLLSREMAVTGTSRRAHDSTYRLVAGKAAVTRDRYHEMRVALVEASGSRRRRLELFFRAYDDGVAFRYFIPAQTGLGEFEIVDERSEFRFAADYKCWAMQLRTFHSNYEKEFDPLSVGRIKPGAKIGLPLTIQAEGGPALAVAEADLRDYAGMYLQGLEGVPNALVSRLSPFGGREEGSAVRGRAPHASPWRVLMLGDAPGRLVESTLLLNLNPPSVVRDPSWIRPGKAAWDWWSGQAAEGVAQPGMNDATMRHYIDFASEMGLEYMLVDAGWYASKAYGEGADTKADITKSVPEIDLPGLVRYARSKRVGIILWLHWQTARDQMDAAFPFYERLGVKGVKVDFMDHDDQEMVAFYHRILRKAAEHHLVVDLHGAFKPTGLARTYPNYLTQEGVMGAEYNKWSARVTATHNVTLPFTRMLAGPLDYTPGGFRNVTPAAFKPQDKLPLVMTTRAQQLAMYVVYESPLQMVADYPGAYRGQPGADFLRAVPTSWDETRVIEGRVGEFVLMARRRGREWYVGAMTNESARTLRLPLSFLGPGEYALGEYADGDGAAEDPTRLSTSERLVKRGDTLTLRLAPSGGYAARLAPARRSR